jgi:hypothetical protein
MVDAPQASNSTSRADARGVSIGELIELVKTYAEQETLGPIRGAWRWLALGCAATGMFGLGLTVLMLGLLRLIQTEWEDVTTGSMSWLPYLIVFVVLVGIILITVSRINKSSLNKESN